MASFLIYYIISYFSDYLCLSIYKRSLEFHIVSLKEVISSLILLCGLPHSIVRIN